MTQSQRRPRRHIRFGMLGTACALGVALALSATSLAAAGSGQPAHAVQPGKSQSLLVTTGKGQIQGRTTGFVDQLLGIPYARPPVGALRWAPPKAMTPWTGVRPALSYGGRCAQLTSGNGPRIDNEDCLYLNVYAPSVLPGGREAARAVHDPRRRAHFRRRRPARRNSCSRSPSTSSSCRSTTGSARSASSACPACPARCPTATSGCWTRRRRWGGLRSNIAAFGGDPSQVTIAGESAGGWSVCALLASPAAKGLFARAIMESGSCISQTRAQTESSSLAFANAAGCPVATAAACLRGKSEATLLSASSAYQPLFIAGGPTLPVAPQQAVTSGDYNRVPILFGDEPRRGPHVHAGLRVEQRRRSTWRSSNRQLRRARAAGARAVPVERVPDRRTRRRTPSARSGRTAARSAGSAAAPSRTWPSRSSKTTTHVLLPVRRQARARPEQRRARIPVGGGSRDGAGVPVAQLHQRVLALRRAHPGAAAAVAADDRLLGSVHEVGVSAGARPAPTGPLTRVREARTRG